MPALSWPPVLELVEAVKGQFRCARMPINAENTTIMFGILLHTHTESLSRGEHSIKLPAVQVKLSQIIRLRPAFCNWRRLLRGHRVVQNTVIQPATDLGFSLMGKSGTIWPIFWPGWMPPQTV